MSVSISRDEVLNLMKNWNIKEFDILESKLGRKLTDAEIKEIVYYVIGYYDYSSNATLGNLVENIGLTLSEDEFNKIKDVEI